MTLPVRPLRREPDAGLGAAGSAAQRLALVTTLTLEAGTLARRDVPTCARGYAGVPRATGGIDIGIDRAPGTVVRVWRAMEAFGASAEAMGIRPADLEAPDAVSQIGLPSRRIEVLTDVTGVVFDVARNARVVHRVGALDIPFLAREDLLRNRCATGRYMDLGDIEALGEDPHVEG